MARTKFFFFESLRRIGTSLFNFFSRCEECGVLPRASRWVKTTFLGAFVTGITALSAASMINCIPTGCYLPIESPRIENASVAPNPTAGADTVSVSAKAIADNGIELKKVICILENDTTVMKIEPGDYTNEYAVNAKLYIGDLEPDTVTIQITEYDNEDQRADTTIDLEITE